MKATFIPFVIGALGIIKGTAELGSKRMSGEHSNYCIIEIGQNTEKNPGDLRKLAVIQTSEKNHQLMLMWKKSQVVK